MVVVVVVVVVVAAAVAVVAVVVVAAVVIVVVVVVVVVVVAVEKDSKGVEPLRKGFGIASKFYSLPYPFSFPCATFWHWKLPFQRHGICSILEFG